MVDEFHSCWEGLRVEARRRGRDLGHKHTFAAISTLLLSQRPFKDQSRPRELVIELSKS